MATKIIINRKSEFVNRRRSIRLFLDGAEQNKIANGGSEEFNVEPGAHILRAKIDWCGSPEMQINIGEGERKFIRLKSGMKFYGITLIWVLIVAFSGFFFKLTGMKEPESYQLIKLIAFLPPLLYILYNLTIGRNTYLVLEEDKENIFN